MMINTTRLVGIDGTDAQSLSEGMMRGRAETERLMELMRKHFPGFGEARLKCVAPALGIRETRRIHGAYTLTVEDLVAGRDFADTIGFSAYGWDLPDPQRPSLPKSTAQRFAENWPNTTLWLTGNDTRSKERVCSFWRIADTRFA